MLIDEIKAAASSDIRALAEEAGFRLARGRTYHCGRHRDRTPSAHLYDDAIHCFSCSERHDPIDLARLIIDGSTRDAIRWLASRYGIAQDLPTRRPQFSEAEYTNAELFRTGFCWALERELAQLKRPLQGTDLIEGVQIFRLTRLLGQARARSPRQAAAFFVGLQRRDSRRVKRWIQEALESQVALATTIAYANTEKAEAAA